MTQPMETKIVVGDPNWAPLEAVLPENECALFMYMGRAGEIELYKHRFTRRYLNIASNARRFYLYSNGNYAEVSEAVALEHVRG